MPTTNDFARSGVLATGSLLFAIVAAASCGAGGGGASTPPPNIDPSLGLATLTATQKAEICDWQAAKFGGYGSVPSCPDGSGNIALPANQAQCVAAFNFSPNTCTATVMDEFNCVDVLTQSPCQSTQNNAPECTPINTCE